MLQAILRKISTFELVDGDWLKEYLWRFDLEEETDYYLQAAGIDSVYFQFTFGFPLSPIRVLLLPMPGHYSVDKILFY